MNAPLPAPPAIAMSPAAARRIAAITAKDPAAGALRIAVEGGGCSGFSYKFDLVPGAADPDDIVVERDGARLLVDTMSAQYMAGSTVDFVDDLMGQAFRIDNPNAVASCGCGTSFSL